MNFNCVICQDLFNPQSDVVVTNCGHMFHSECIHQWLDRSKTCPQCRHQTSETKIHKLFFNFLTSNKETEEDPVNLRFQLDSMEYQLKLSKMDIVKIREKKKAYSIANKGLRSMISQLEHQEQTNVITIAELKKDLKIAEKIKCSYLQSLDEINNLKKELEKLNNVKRVVVDYEQDIEEMLNSNPEINSLTTMVVMLRKELINQVEKNKNSKTALRIISNDLSNAKKKIKEIDELNLQIRNLKDDLQLMKEEKDKLKSKLDLLEQNNNKKPLKRKLDSSSSVIDLDTSTDEPHPSTSIQKEVENIENSQSPYMKLKKSALNFSPSSMNLAQTTVVQKDTHSKYIIFKKTKPANPSIDYLRSRIQVQNNDLNDDNEDEEEVKDKFIPKRILTKKRTIAKKCKTNNDQNLKRIDSFFNK